ncbi:MAG TPA: sugar phosphate isomerase/epimerase family protein [Pseudomonadales bacterium]|nr:sugar phosphate isomerase/epimerase family protein [Pseudomonadales bacterium]
MSKIGIYYAYWAHDWDVDFHPIIDKVCTLGFDILEVNAGTITNLTSLERKDLKAHAAERNIGLSYCIGLPPSYDLASEDGAIRRNGVIYLQKMAQAIGEMGGGNLGGIIYSCWPMLMPAGDFDKKKSIERSVTSMREAVKAAEDNQVFFNMEVVNRFEQFIMNTCAEGIAYVDAVGSPNAKVMLDTFHMNIEEDFIGDAIELAGNKLGHFHIGENNRMPPGYGHIPWTEVGSALRKIKYKGDIVMEPFLMPGGQIGRDIKVFRNLSSGLDLDEEARKALLFMRGVLK